MKIQRQLWRRREARVAYTYSFILSVLLFFPLPQAPGIPSDAHIDKFIHIFLFAILTVVWLRALRAGIRVSFQYLVIPFSYALFTEVVQGLLPYRSADPFDLVCDAVGILSAYLIVRLNPALVNR